MLYLASLALLVAADAPKLPEVGKPAPAFKLPAANVEAVKQLKGKKEVALEDLKGKTVVLFFFPKAMTKG